MKNLVFFDVDGTISTRKDSEYIIPESAIQAIKLLKENGNLCFINSGRTMSEMDSSILDIGMDGYVCGCGTYISYKDNLLFSKTIPYALGNEIIKDLEMCNVDWLLEGQQTIYYSSAMHQTQLGNFVKNMEDLSLSCSIVDPADAYNLDFDKFCVCLLPGSNFNYFASKYKDKFSIIDRSGGFYEVVPEGCSKATGMKYLMDYFDIMPENTYAAGDSTNDLPMIKFAGTGIAMGESPENVIKYADYVTDPVLGDGIYNAMKHFNLI